MWATNDITYKLLRIIDIAISSSQSVGNLIKEAYRAYRAKLFDSSGETANSLL